MKICCWQEGASVGTGGGIGWNVWPKDWLKIRGASKWNRREYTGKGTNFGMDYFRTGYSIEGRFVVASTFRKWDGVLVWFEVGRTGQLTG